MSDARSSSGGAGYIGAVLVQLLRRKALFASSTGCSARSHGLADLAEERA
jgi:hypothetical protein